MRMQVRRPLSLLLVVALVLSLSICAFAAGTSQLSLALSADCYYQGTAQILVMADKADAVADGKLVVTYDAQSLQYVGAEVGTAWPEGSDVSLQVNASEAGKLIVAFAGAYEAAKGDVVKLNFTALKEGSSKVSLSDEYAGGTSELEVTAACPSAQFTDVNKTAWYHEGVDYAIVKGYMNGVSATKFQPNGNTTRAMLVTVLYRIAGQPSVEGMTTPFTDLKQEWYKAPVAWAYNTGIAQGMTATGFSPDGKLTREQTATFLYRFAAQVGANMDVKGDLSAFTDGAKVSSWAKDSMSWAVGSGLLGSTSTTAMTLAPKGPATRGQIAKILRDFDLKVLG